MLQLASLGWGAKRISRELGSSGETLRGFFCVKAVHSLTSPRPGQVG